jgi:hypothetical protein
MRVSALSLVLVLSVSVHSQVPAPGQPAPRDPAREVATSVADGFTLASVGDLIIARPISHNRDAAFT